MSTTTTDSTVQLPETVHVSTASNSNKKLHTTADCKGVENTKTLVEKPLSVYPEGWRDWCGNCSPHIRAVGTMEPTVAYATEWTLRRFFNREENCKLHASEACHALNRSGATVTEIVVDEMEQDYDWCSWCSEELKE